MPESVDDLLRYATAFTLHDGPVPPLVHPVMVVARDGFGDDMREVRRWAVMRNGDVWSKSEGAFVIEPLPSDRDETFMADARFDSIADAFAVAVRLTGDL